MRALGQGSLSAVLKVAIDGLWGLSWLAVGLSLIIGVLYPLAIASGGRLDLPAFRVDGDPRVWQDVLFSGLVFLAYAIACVVITSRLREIFATLIAGDPFVPENAKRLRMIWGAVLVLEVGRLAIVLGAHGLSALLGGETSVLWSWTPNLAVLASVSVLIVLEHVFREGAQLRDEVQMTV